MTLGTENALLFFFTAIAYFVVLAAVYFIHKGVPQNLPKHIKIAGLATLLALPININGNVFTIAGSAKAEKNIYSVFSTYQEAGHNAYAGVSLANQEAENNAFALISLIHQKAGNNTFNIFGLAYQNAGRDAETVFGLAYQNAGRDAETVFGLAYQNAGQSAVTVLGLAVYQRAELKAEVPVAIALYQRVGEKTRAFGAFSSLTKD